MRQKKERKEKMGRVRSREERWEEAKKKMKQKHTSVVSNDRRERRIQYEGARKGGRSKRKNKTEDRDGRQKQ